MKAIYNTAFTVAMILAAIWLYPEHPILSGTALTLFGIAFVLHGVSLYLKRKKPKQ